MRVGTEYTVYGRVYRGSRMEARAVHRSFLSEDQATAYFIEQLMVAGVFNGGTLTGLQAVIVRETTRRRTPEDPKPRTNLPRGEWVAERSVLHSVGGGLAWYE